MAVKAFGTNISSPSTWAPGTSYSAGQSVFFQGGVWSARTAHTSGATFSGFTNWRMISSAFRQTRWEGLKLLVDGMSIPAGTGAQWNFGYPSMVQARLNLLAVTNHAVGGVSSARIAALQTVIDAFGSGAAGTPGSRTPWAYLWDGGINDYVGPTAKSLAKVAGAFTYSALSIRTRGSSSVNLGVDGTWSDGPTGFTIPGITPKMTTTQDGIATLTGSAMAGRSVMVTLIGIDNATVTPLGGTYAISVGSDSSGETVVATGTTADKSNKGIDDTGRSVLPVVVSVPAGTNPYVKIKKTDASGTQVALAANGKHPVLNPAGSADNPIGMFIRQPRVPYVSNAIVDAFNAQQDSIITALGGAGVDMFNVSPEVYGFDGTADTTDGLHPNQQGHLKYATALAGAVYEAAAGIG